MRLPTGSGFSSERLLQVPMIGQVPPKAYVMSSSGRLPEGSVRDRRLHRERETAALDKRDAFAYARRRYKASAAATNKTRACSSVG